MREGFSLSSARQQLFREKAAMDYRSGMDAARDEGRQEEEAAGLAKGIAVGDTRGFEQARLEIARKELLHDSA